MLRQWLQSVLLHGVLLLCAVLYHLHGHRSLHFGANSVDMMVTSANMILSDNDSDFLELSFEQYEMAEPQQTEAKLTEISTSLAPRIEPERPARASTQPTSRVSPSARASTQPTSRVPPSARASTQPTSRVSPSASAVAAQTRQTARPDHAQSPKPIYPLALRDLGVSGVVWLRVWVDHTGRPREIELAKGSGYRLFDEAALRAVQHWRFIPAKNEQQSLASWVEFAVRFVING